MQWYICWVKSLVIEVMITEMPLQLPGSVTEMKVCVYDCLLHVVKLRNEYDICIHYCLQQHEEHCALENSTDGLQEFT